MGLAGNIELYGIRRKKDFMGLNEEKALVVLSFYVEHTRKFDGLFRLSFTGNWSGFTTACCLQFQLYNVCMYTYSVHEPYTRPGIFWTFHSEPMFSILGNLHVCQLGRHKTVWFKRNLICMCIAGINFVLALKENIKFEKNICQLFQHRPTFSVSF